MNIPNFDLLKSIWSRSEGSYAAISTMHRPEPHKRGTWRDEFYAPSWDLHDPLLGVQPHEHDLFFSPLLYTSQKRSNIDVGKPGVLFADLDNAPKPVFPPSVLWETSPGNLQAIWYLTDPVEDYERWAQVNRKLTVYTGADPGGWMGSKVLRVPGSVNWKRREFGRLLIARNTTQDFEWYEDKLANIPDAQLTPKMDTTPALIDPKERDWLLRSSWQRLTPFARALLTKERVSDRSLHIVRTINELVKHTDLPDDTIFGLIWVAPWCKWRTDRHAPGMLMQEISRARG